MEKRSLIYSIGGLIGAVLLSGLLVYTENMLGESMVLLLTGALFYFYNQSQRHFLKEQNEWLEKVVAGEEVPDQVALREQRFYKNLRKLSDRNREVIGFLNAMDKGGVKLTHIRKDEPIGIALSGITARQKELDEESNRRRWVTEGIARFGEILRVMDQDLDTISENVLRYLVKYLGANQGGVFIQFGEEEERHLKLTACYAYDRKKYEDKVIPLGQGILGQVMLEHSMVHLREVPDGYTRITSGLGDQTAGYLIIVPLVLNDTFYGAIEIASFTDFDAHHKEFLAQVSENVASAFASILTNEQTRNLLTESRHMAQELQEREEEMRQNMEELQATQEEMRRKQAELDSILHAISATQGIIEFDQDGNVLTANDTLLDMIDCPLELLQSSNHYVLPDDKSPKSYFREILQGDLTSAEYKIYTLANREVWLQTTYSLIRDHGGNVVKIFVLVTDVTNEREKNAEQMERLSLVADNTANSVIITDKEGMIEYVNRGFEDMTGYSTEEVLGKKPGSLLQGPSTDAETVVRLSKAIKAGRSIYEEILNYKKNGDTYWVSLTINPVRNAKREIYKFIAVQADITQTKIRSLDYKCQLEAISRSNAILEMDLDGTIRDANDNFLQIVRYGREELIGKHHSVLVPEEIATHKDYIDHWDKLKKGDFINDEFERIDRHGKTLFLKGIYNPIIDIDGKPVRILKFVTDITHEKELQAEAEEQRREITSHMETINMTIATLEFDRDGKITFVNKVYLDVSGYSKPDLMGKPYDLLIPESEKDKPQTQMMWASLKSGNAFTGEFKQQDSSGRVMWLTGTFNPILDTEGQPEKIMMFAQFITSARDKQEDLLQTVHAFKEAVPIMELKADGMIKNVNSKFTGLLGYSRMDLREKSLSDLLPGTLQNASEEILTSLSENDQVYLHLSLAGKDGTEYCFECMFQNIRNMDGEVNRIMMVMILQEKFQKV